MLRRSAQENEKNGKEVQGRQLNKGEEEAPCKESGMSASRSWASLVTQCKESAYQCRRHGFDPWMGKIP